MKGIVAGFVIILFLASCKNGKVEVDPFSSIISEVDSIKALRSDSVLTILQPQEAQPIRADETFDDFIYNFASDSVLQSKRIKFPLPFYNRDKKITIDKSSWKHDDLFVKQPYYVLLFDKESDMELAGDTSLTSVQVEWMYLKERVMKKYYFERIKGAWMLEAMNLYDIKEEGEEDFINFFYHFASDSLFQSRRVSNPLIFVTSDPDDDFSILETTIDHNQWFAFRPSLPVERLSNINYGQSNDWDSSTKILALKGVGNGFSNLLYFRKETGKWILYKFEDTSI